MTIAIVVAVVILLFLAFVASRPGEFRVERRATIGASAEKLHALVSDFHQWPTFSPWEKLDPEMKRTHGGSASGKGATYAWEGNKKVGRGGMEILESVPPSKIVIKLDFLKPFEAHNTTEFHFRPGGSGTEVTWAMFGPQPFMMKLMGVFMNMDKMVGKDFEAGLANLKAASER